MDFPFWVNRGNQEDQGGELGESIPNQWTPIQIISLFSRPFPLCPPFVCGVPIG